MGSIPGQGAKILHASQPVNQNIKQKQYSKKFNKDFIKMVPIQKKKNFRETKKTKTSSMPLSLPFSYSSLIPYLITHTHAPKPKETLTVFKNVNLICSQSQ